MLPQAQDRDTWRGWGVSAALHGAVCLALLAAAAPRRPTERERVVEVEIVSAPAAAPPRVDGAPVATENPPPAPPANPAPVAPAPSDAMVQPGRMLSDGVLSEARNRKTRQALARLAPEDRVEQLCALEAMAQVHAFRAEIVADRVQIRATAEAQVTAGVVLADGAAVHGGREWRRLTFRCELTGDRAHVAAFAFRLGEAIPPAQWARFNLPSEGPPQD